MPEITSDIDRIIDVSRGLTPIAAHIRKRSVTVGTIIARRCWKAEKNDQRLEFIVNPVKRICYLCPAKVKNYDQATISNIGGPFL